MHQYDPKKKPKPGEWLALDEAERIVMAERYHSRHGDFGESLSMHSTIHSIVETQLAEKVPAVKAAFKRLRRQGLNRHDTIHAIGSVLAEQVWEIMAGTPASEDANDDYFAALESLTAESWYEKYDEDA
ncbi:MAG: DUF1841 family protein [Proteobacteria bacterium]|nr:DUF1841 family protein [Pseudomonadota bacterium]